MSRTGVPRSRVEDPTRRETEAFSNTHPRNRTAAQAADDVLLFGVPMVRQAGIEGPLSIFVEGGSGNRVTDIDLAPAVFRECCEAPVAGVPV